MAPSHSAEVFVTEADLVVLDLGLDHHFEGEKGGPVEHWEGRGTYLQLPKLCKIISIWGLSSMGFGPLFYILLGCR